MKQTRSCIRMMTIREVARTGLLPEHCIRRMVKTGEIPAIYSGNRALINYNNLVSMLNGETIAAQES